MCLMMKKNKKIIVTFLLLMEIVLVNLTYQSFLHKEITKEENKITKKQFAMFIQDDNKYVEYKGDNLFPKDYYVNKSLSKCVDENDNPVENVISSLGNSVTITSNKTIYCTLYFDKNEILEYLRSKDTNKSLSADIVGGLYRYQGVKSSEFIVDNEKVVDNNYLCLGSDCTEEGNDLYRIIGVTETGELKVIKENYLSAQKWYDDMYADIKWPDSNIFHVLNDNQDSFYNSLDSKLQEKIVQNHKWMYGDTTDYWQNLDGLYFYLVETGEIEATRGIKAETQKTDKYTWDKEKDYVEAPMGLMYMHDYLLGYNSTTLGNNSNLINSWLYKGSEFLMIRRGFHTNFIAIRLIYPTGLFDSTTSSDPKPIRPVFYLSNDILITGEGTLTEPFKIGLEDENNHEKFEYPFKGNYETFTVFKDGTYQIELWGAKGGGANGGLGAYTSGNIDLKKNDKLYIYVGENPTYINGNCYRTNPNNSFNGSNVGSCAGGGGATDVRLENGEWDNFDGLKSRIMVAAGGGGAGYTGYGGYGGALTGGDGEGFADYWTDRAGKGATQESYKFGVAEWSTHIPGNGYFSGEALGGANVGGGSSYISGYPGCKAITKESTESNITHTESPDHYSGKIFSDPVMIAGNDTMPNYNGGSMVGNSGNGYARITKIK